MKKERNIEKLSLGEQESVRCCTFYKKKENVVKMGRFLISYMTRHCRHLETFIKAVLLKWDIYVFVWICLSENTVIIFNVQHFCKVSQHESHQMSTNSNWNSPKHHERLRNCRPELSGFQDQNGELQGKKRLDMIFSLWKSSQGATPTGGRRTQNNNNKEVLLWCQKYARKCLLFLMWSNRLNIWATTIVITGHY